MDLSFLQNIGIAGKNQMPLVPGGPQTPLNIPLANSAPDLSGGQAGSGGTGFEWLDNIRSDPNSKRALLIAGLNMMMAQPGESTLGAVGRGALTGIDYYGRKTAADEEATMKKRKDEAALAASAESLKTSQITNENLPGKLQTEQDIAGQDLEKKTKDNEKAAKTLGDFLRKAQAEADKAVDEASHSKIVAAADKRLEALRLKHPEWEAQIEQSKVDLAGLQPKKARADIAQSNAAANASNVSAKKSQQEIDSFNLLTDEEKRNAQIAKSRGTSPSALEQNVLGMMTAWDTINEKPADAAKVPGWRKQRAQYELDIRNRISTQAKVNRVQALKAIIETAENPNDPSVIAAQAELQGLSGSGVGTVVPATATPATAGTWVPGKGFVK